ncbi:MAG: HepT-like ribonuclease domain-containing protein [Leptolyngbya sp.]|nr:HepT-like ribonuclease domain-containing protein [Leptolyngbya sp.]
MRSNVERLQDIYEAILQIERYATKGEAEFRQDELVQTWIAYHLQIIGEAARTVIEQNLPFLKEQVKGLLDRLDQA